jgi:protein phosphatase 1L
MTSYTVLENCAKFCYFCLQEKEIGPEDEFLLLASDGLWDVVKDQDACQLVEKELDAEAAAKFLTEEAFKRGSADNITCIVVRFHTNRQ